MRRKGHFFLKRVAVLVTAASLLAVSLAGCGSKGQTEPGQSQTSGDPSAVQAGTEDKTETPSPSPSRDPDYNPAKPAAKPTKEPKEEDPNKFVSDRSEVFALFDKMNVGWNLGNTFDSHGAGNSLRAETYWGNPETTKEMIDEIAKEGFNTIRIPVTWAQHVGKAPDYEINAEWLDRVQEVVDYAVANDMFIILNTHHEPDFWLIPDEAHREAATAELSAIWTQLAERFKDYDEKLIFEGMNEPRVKGSEKEWNGGTPDERKIINEWNAAFVKAVRAVGGNNEKRVLIICPYGNSATYAAIKDLEIPEDNYIAVAVHLYTPYFFTYEPKEGSIEVWDGSLKKDILSAMSDVKLELIKNDVPAIITEFGAVNKGKPEEVIKWLADYLETSNRLGLKCIWWDNGNYKASGEKFAIFNRKQLSWFEKGIADAMIEFSEKPVESAN